MALTATLDMWYVLVETIFGSVWLAFFGLAAIYLLILFIGRASPWLSFYTIFLFAFTYGAYSFGAFMLMPLFILATIYFIFSAVRFFGGYSPIAT